MPLPGATRQLPLVHLRSVYLLQLFHQLVDRLLIRGHIAGAHVVFAGSRRYPGGCASAGAAAAHQGERPARHRTGTAR